MRIKPAAILAIIAAAILLPYAAVLLFGEITIPVQNRSSEKQIQAESETISIEEYVIRLVAAQIPADYHIEALKAQSVIARTYLCQAMGENQMLAETELLEQGWGEEKMKEEWKENWNENLEKIRRAVKETEHKIVTFNGEATQLLHHRASSGTTRSDESGACPYLKGKESSYDIEADGYLQMKVFTEQEFAKTLQSTYPDRAIVADNILSTLQILSKDSSGYIEKMQIGGCEFQGIEIANALQMSSSCMSFEEYEGKVRVMSRGIGHGYGMSQWGASKMGEEGKSWEDILQYYYDFSAGLQIQTNREI